MTIAVNIKRIDQLCDTLEGHLVCILNKRDNKKHKKIVPPRNKDRTVTTTN